MKHKKVLFFMLKFIAFILVVYALYHFNIILHKQYSNEDFKIHRYISQTDKDSDGIDDQTDILDGVRSYIVTNPNIKANIMKLVIRMTDMAFVRMLWRLACRMRGMI